ncbi:MAG: cell division protein ZapA [Caulobacterales bacterium]|nr:cell division protein ZapA [Caulobacterales bacterium]
MATVTVEINGRPHQVGCAEGQQDRVKDLAAQFDRHVRQVAGDVGQVGDLRLFLMAGLLLADENQDLKSGAQVELPADDAAIVEALNEAAARIEALTAGL